MKTTLLAGLLAVFVALLWCGLYEKYSPVSWRQPISYSGDDPQVLGWIKAAQQGDWPLLLPKRVHRVGAPDEYANWHDFPMYAEIEIWALGWIARVSDIATAANIGMLLARVTTALGFFFAALHLLKCRPLWAWVGAVAWSCVYFHTFRGLGHMFLAFTWAVPILVAVSWRLPDVNLRSAFLIGMAGGLSNPYITLLGLLLLFAAKGVKEKVTAIAGSLCGFLLCNVDTLLFSNGYKLTRNYFESELYALKPLELFLPPPGHWLDFLSAGYAAKAAIRGEMFSPYLGLVAIAALVWLLWERRHIALGQAATVTLISCIGGLTAVLALGGVTMFRASNRWSIFVAAILLLWLVQRLSATKWTPERAFYVAAAILGISCWEMLTFAPHKAGMREAVARYAQDKAFGAELDRSMSEAVLYCFPPMAFPDTNPVGPVEPYDMLRPWLHTERVRFSAGKVRTTLDDYDSLRMWPSVETLCSKGFTGLLISRKMFADGGATFAENFKQKAIGSEYIAVEFEY